MSDSAKKARSGQPATSSTSSAQASASTPGSGKAPRGAKSARPAGKPAAKLTQRAPAEVLQKVRLLVSVRDAEEAGLALEAGADLIDVKDPSRGSLGMAHHETVAAVLDVVQEKVPVSAALGEWSPQLLTDAGWHLELPVQYLKWGLAGYKHTPGWGEDLLETKRQIPTGPEVVMCAYADWEKAQSLPPLEVARFAKRFRYKVALLDTFRKDLGTLFDHLSLAEITQWIETLRAGGVQVALGGSVVPEMVHRLGACQPDWYAVRGSVCVAGRRDGSLDPLRIRHWKDTLGQ